MLRPQRTAFTRSSRRPPALGRLASLALLLTLAACTPPQFEGPQIQAPPEGFFYDANSSQARKVFDDREVLAEGAWLSNLADEDELSVISLTTFRGPVTRAEVEAAREALIARWGRPTTEYGPVRTYRIDDRDAWGWLETNRFGGSLRSRELKVVVPYDSVSYAIEFYTRDPLFLEPAELEAVVGTFAVGRTEWNLPGLALGALIALVVLALLRERLRAYVERRTAPDPRTREMRLARIPTPGGDAPPRGDAGAGAGGAAAAPPSPRADRAPEPPSGGDAPPPPV
ncbi:MAG: hypothetical protein D6701_13780, partial [Gemmatimonadetes bacterium]